MKKQHTYTFHKLVNEKWCTVCVRVPFIVCCFLKVDCDSAEKKSDF